jgi:hypothetical protein
MLQDPPPPRDDRPMSRGEFWFLIALVVLAGLVGAFVMGLWLSR